MSDAIPDTRNEYERMINGEPYLPTDPIVQAKALAGAERRKSFNTTKTPDERAKLGREIFSSSPGSSFYIETPLFFEYGHHIIIGNDVYIGPNCYFLDPCSITIGDRSLIGPNVCVYTPVHPLRPEARNGTKGKEWACPVVIGKDVWIAGSVVINGGVTIGDGSTIGSGSVVTKSIPSRVFAAGNPARVIKSVDDHVDQSRLEE